MSHEPHEEPLSVDKRAIPSSVTRLSPLYPLDHLRLLWWTLVMPQELKRYQEQFGEAAVKQTGKWLVSTLIWLPFLYPTLALGLEMLPRSVDVSSPTSYLWISGGLLIAWLLTGIFGDGDNCGMVVLAVVLMIILAPLLMITLHAGLIGVLPVGVLFVLLMVISVGMAGILALVLTLVLETGVVVIVSSVLGGELLTLQRTFEVTLKGFPLRFIIVIIIALMPALAIRLANVVKESLKTGHPSWLARGGFGLLVVAHAFLVWFSFLGGWWVFGALF